jgi:DNA repair exonuclease SbcCD nuclease subunit
MVQDLSTLVIGDLHFENKLLGMLEAQKAAVIEICKGQRSACTHVIFLGDLMMHRNPRPEVLLALKDMFDTISEELGFGIYILRGNHDSVSKSDDGITSLSLFEGPNVKVITQTWVDPENDWVFIPHYENEQKIKDDLSNVPEGHTVFGHFGYYGVLNSAGDSDFNLTISDFKNPTILGHIHNESKNENVSILGTPYTTNFGEASKDCFFGILTGGHFEKFPSFGGPRHIVIDYDDVEDNLDWINQSCRSPKNFTLLRITINSTNEDQNRIADLCDKLQVGHVEIMYKPLLDAKEEFETDNKVFTTAINDELIEHYINSSNASINKDDLLSGLKLIHENKQNRDI